MIVHLGTKVQTILAQIDTDGNVVKQFPITADLQKVEQLAAAVAQIELHRKKLEAEDECITVS